MMGNLWETHLRTIIEQNITSEIPCSTNQTWWCHVVSTCKLSIEPVTLKLQHPQQRVHLLQYGKRSCASSHGK